MDERFANTKQEIKNAAVKLVTVISNKDGSFKQQLWVEGVCVLESKSGNISLVEALAAITTEVWGSSGAFAVSSMHTNRTYK